MAKVGYLIQFAVNDGKFDEVQKLASGYIDAAKNNEPGTMTYQWFVDEESKSIAILEQFPDSAAMMVHLGNVGPSLPDLLAVAPLASLDVLGAVSDEARAALAALGAKHFNSMGGFER